MSYSKDDHLKWDLALLMPSTFISHVRHMLSWSKINQKYETEKLRDSPKRITFAIGYNGLFEIVKMKWSYALYDLLIHCPFSRWFSHIACSQAIIPNCIKDTDKSSAKANFICDFAEAEYLRHSQRYVKNTIVRLGVVLVGYGRNFFRRKIWITENLIYLCTRNRVTRRRL